MPVDRFFLDSSLEPGKSHFLDPKESHHLLKVTRHKINDQVELINGKGDLSLATISSIDRSQATITIQTTEHYSPPPYSLDLAIGSMRGSKLEWIVEKATELGATSFLFFQADRSEKEKFSDSLCKRLEFIAISAMKQSGRLYLPSFSFFSNLEKLLQQETKAEIFYGEMQEGKETEILPTKSLFISGPESGFSEKEKKLLKEKAKALSLSDQTLRAETAPIAFAAIFSFKARRLGR